MSAKNTPSWARRRPRQQPHQLPHPLGQAIFGSEPGAEVEVQLGDEIRRMRVDSIAPLASRPQTMRTVKVPLADRSYPILWGADCRGPRCPMRAT